MDARDVLTLLDRERRSHAQDSEILDVVPEVVRLRGANASYHLVISSCLTYDSADAMIAREIEHHRALNVDFEWKLYAHDSPPDLLERLKRHGFEIGPREAVMVLNLTRAPTWIDNSVQIQVVRVDRLEQIDVYRRLAEEIFEKDYQLTAGQLTDAIKAGSIQHRGYIALDAETAVSIGRLYTHPGSAFAGLYGGGTLKKYRGKGFYRALVAARARDAIAFGARFLLVDALPTSQPILERMGFMLLTHTWPCQWRPEVQ